MSGARDGASSGRGLPGWAVSLAMAVAFVGLLAAFLPRTYLENDNTAIVDDLKAGTSIQYIGYFWSLCLSWLYRSFEGFVPWYALALYAAHVLSLFLFFEFLRREVPGLRARALLVPTYLLVYTVFVQRVGYNSTSIMLGGNALLLFLSLVRRPRVPRAALILLGLTFALSFAIRTKGPLAPVVFLLPAILQTARGRWGVVARRAAFVVVPAVFVVGIDSFAYRSTMDEANRAYIEFNRLRGKLHGYHILEANRGNQAILDANGWSANDYEMFERWIFIDEEKFNTETLRNVLEHAQPANTTPKELALATVPAFEKYWFVLCLLPGIVWVAAASRSRRVFTETAFQAAYAFLLVLAMTVFLRFPTRVGDPILLVVMTLLAVTLARAHAAGGTRPEFRWISAALLGLVVVPSAIGVFRGVEKADRDHRELVRDLNKLNEYGLGSVFVFQPGKGMKWQRSDPLREYDIGFHAIRIGWNTFSPDFYASLEPLGIDQASQIFSVLRRRTDAFMVADNDVAEPLTTFIDERHGKNSLLVSDWRLSTGAMVYRLEPFSMGELKRQLYKDLPQDTLEELDRKRIRRERRNRDAANDEGEEGGS